jgi:hypothetical protein
MMRLKHGLALTSALSLCACATVGKVVGHVNRIPPSTASSYQFLERVYAVTSTEDTSIMYEAQVPMHIFVADRLPRAYERVAGGDKPELFAGAWRMIVTPMFRVRQLKDSSAAVRTPSFMPRVSLERSGVLRIGEATSFLDPFPGVVLMGFRTTLAHHSNGQAGCFRQGFVPRDNRSNDCIVDPAVPVDTTIVRINRANGDFSSTFVSFLGHATFIKRSDDDNSALWSAGAGVSHDWHPHDIGGALTDEQRELYGSSRTRLMLEGMYRVGTDCLTDTATYRKRPTWMKAACLLRGNIRPEYLYEWAPKDPPGSLSNRINPPVIPWRRSLGISYTFDVLLGAGIWARQHDGQDYYNIGFVNRRREVLWGLTLDLGGIDRIGNAVVP